MQLYETIYIVKQDIGTVELKAVEEKYEGLLKLNKATIEYKENWGFRNLAYKIDNNKKGYYYLIVFNSEPNAVAEIERNFKIDESIIRFITTRIDKVPTEPSPIMKNKIEKENADSLIVQPNLVENES
jgi:small subunit ribosomal protein S6